MEQGIGELEKKKKETLQELVLEQRRRDWLQRQRRIERLRRKAFFKMIEKAKAIVGFLFVLVEKRIYM